MKVHTHTPLILAVAILAICISRADAGGIPVIFSYGGEQAIKVASFPQTDEFRSKEGQHIDAGYRYKQLCVFWIPLWNYDEQWCGYLGSDSYIDLSKSDLFSAALAAGVILPATPGLPFWHMYGGKLLIGAILFLLTVMGRSGESPSTASPAAVPRPVGTGAIIPERMPPSSASYRIGSNGEDLGDIPVPEIKHMLRSGTLTPQDFYFDPERNEWLPLASLPSLS